MALGAALENLSMKAKELGILLRYNCFPLPGEE